MPYIKNKATGAKVEVGADHPAMFGRMPEWEPVDQGVEVDLGGLTDPIPPQSAPEILAPEPGREIESPELEPTAPKKTGKR